MVGCFLGGFDRFLGAGGGFLFFGFNAFSASFVEVIGLDDDGSVAFFFNVYSGFKGLIMSTLSVL